MNMISILSDLHQSNLDILIDLDFVSFSSSPALGHT